MLTHFTRLVLRFRVAVIISWIAVAIFGVFATLGVNAKLSTSLAVPGSDSTKAEEITVRNFGENSEGTFTVVFPFTHATTEEITSSNQK